jgi:hypothetical protein
MPLLTTFFWQTSSFSGSGQLNMGPFFVGFVEKFYKFEVNGQINFQGSAISVASVLANPIVFGVQQVPHTAAGEDIITSFDSETWLVRRQTGSQDLVTTWAPSTDTAAVLGSLATRDRWAGQLAIGGDTDLWVSMKTSNGSSTGNINTFGTVRLWWN